MNFGLNDLPKTWPIVPGLILLLFSSLFILDSGLKEDGVFHYLKAGDNCEFSSNPKCLTYPGLYHFFAGFFSSSENSFLAFNLLLFGIVGFFLMIWACRSFWGGWFYVTSSNFLYFILHYGAFSSGLAVLLWIVLVRTRSAYLKIILILLSPLVHNSAFMLFIFTTIVTEAWIFLKRKEYLLVFPYTQFSPVEILNETVGKIDFWVKSAFPIFSFLGFLHMLHLRYFHHAFLVVALFIASFNFSRAFLPAMLLLLVAFVGFFEKQNSESKILLIFGSLVFYFFIFMGWTI